MMLYVKNASLFVGLAFFILVSNTYAQANNTLSGAFLNIQSLIKVSISIVYAAIFLAFFWGLAKYLFNASNEEAKKAATNIMLTSILVIFIITSIWGIVALIKNTLGVRDSHQDNFKVPIANPR